MSLLFSDKKFFSQMLRLASPIILQQLIFSSLGMIDTVMIGHLGDASVAAVGVANQVFFLATLLYFGITSGAAIFTAQYWGRKDIPRIQQILGLSLVISLVGGAVFTLVAIGYPQAVLQIYSADPEVISLGGEYLQITALSYIFTAITYSFSVILRSINNVKLPMMTSLFALSLNSLLNFGLIFGNFGLPALGVKGAAIATVTARLFEAFLIVFLVYRKQLPLAARPAALVKWDKIQLGKFFQTTLPVIITEIIWSLGTTTYTVVYAHISTEAIAAYNIALSVDRLIFVIFIGLGNACAIMIGNKIGEGEKDAAILFGKKYLLLGITAALALGLLMLLVKNPLLSLFGVTPETTLLAKNTLLVMIYSLPVRTMNLILLIGILRSGGDTYYAFFIDAGVIWIVGVPMAYLGAYLLHLPVYWVYLMVISEEVVKVSLGLIRFSKGRWIHSLTTA
ncbi:MAG TPA: MATE family efflux transporter [Chloroflexi bacterium]|nr:MAG: MATE family efflux transporter [Chloroflexota bacterium]HDN04754.1 MATE family efflux transporter [Chloroflexota bacterium]